MSPRLALLLVLVALLGVILLLPKWLSHVHFDGVESEGSASVGTTTDGSIILEEKGERPWERMAVTSTEVAVVSPAGPHERVEVLSGSLEVTVLWRGEPLAGASVELFRLGDEDYGFLVGEGTIPIAARARADGAGIARFPEESQGRRGLLARGPGGVDGRTLILMSPDAGTVHVAMHLGTAGLEGAVYDPAGPGGADLRVLVRQDSRWTVTRVWFLAKTDDVGSYRLGGFAGGPEHPITATVLDLRLPDTIPLVLADDEWRRLDFGSPGGMARWSGVVRVTSGGAVAGPGRLFFTDRAQATIQSAFFDEEGHFDVILPAGSYEARLGEPSGTPLGTAEVSGVILQDLLMPGIALRGRVTYVGTKHPVARGPENEVAIALERSDQTRVDAALLRGQGRYGFFGLEPGTYAITTNPWIPAAAPNGRVVIELGENVDELVYDLAITDP